MSRQERRNMIEFIEMMRGFNREDLMCMTDADIEHIYEAAYFQQEHSE